MLEIDVSRDAKKVRMHDASAPVKDPDAQDTAPHELAAVASWARIASAPAAA